MKFTSVIDDYIEEMRLVGRINSAATERDYRGALLAHARDVSNRDPRYTNRDDVKRTLKRWSHPNSQRKQRSILDLTRFRGHLTSWEPKAPERSPSATFTTPIPAGVPS